MFGRGLLGFGFHVDFEMVDFDVVVVVGDEILNVVFVCRIVLETGIWGERMVICDEEVEGAWWMRG